MNALLVPPKYVARRKKPERKIRAFPRFRKPKSGATLTDLVRTTLNRSKSSPRPFGLFLFRDQRAVLWGAHTKHYDSFIERYPRAHVGTYDSTLDVVSLIDDLLEFFTAENPE